MKIAQTQRPSEEISAGDGRFSVFDKIRASMCHHCPVCRHARENPKSKIGKFVREHHADHCRMWKAEKEVYGDGKQMKFEKVEAHMLWKAF